jgi:hypothetical protein
MITARRDAFDDTLDGDAMSHWALGAGSRTGQHCMASIVAGGLHAAARPK